MNETTQNPKDSVAPKTVYVRSVAVEDLPEDVRAKAAGHETLYAVHDADGAPLALVAKRDMAFVLARQNDMTPVSVH